MRYCSNNVFFFFFLSNFFLFLFFFFYKQLTHQTVEVGDPVKGEGKARRVTKHPVLTAYFDPDIRTIHQLYEYV